MVFISFALWWIKIRGLWKLPDGRHWLKGKPGLVLIGRVMLSKSLIQFSVYGWGCVLSLLSTLRIKIPLVKAMVFPVAMYGCESWTIKKAVLKNWCLWTVMLWKTLESPLDCKEIQPVHPKGHQSWIFIRTTDAEAETRILWPPDVNSWLIWKDPDAGKDWRQEKETTEDEMVEYHRLNGHEFEEAPGVGDGQGRLACCSPWGCRESDTTEWLNWCRLKLSVLSLC